MAITTCDNCGMPLEKQNEYHPTIACWAYRGCGNAKQVRSELAYSTTDEARYLQNLPVRDAARFDDLLRIVQERGRQDEFGVVIEWNDYQDYAQVRLLDGTILGESQQTDSDPDSDGDIGEAIRDAVRKARQRVEMGGGQ